MVFRIQYGVYGVNKSELDQLRNISSSLSYEETIDTFKKGKDISLEKKIELEQLKVLSSTFAYEKSGQNIALTEETFDDFDTVYESLRTGVEQELKFFIKNLLDQNVEKFIWSFVNPATETFKHAWNHVLTKFTVSDDRARDQFLNRIRILYRNIFLEKMEIGNEADALALADAYYTVFKVAINQLLDNMKDNIEGQTTPPAQDATTNEIVYR